MPAGDGSDNSIQTRGKGAFYAFGAYARCHSGMTDPRIRHPAGLYAVATTDSLCPAVLTCREAMMASSAIAGLRL